MLATGVEPAVDGRGRITKTPMDIKRSYVIKRTGRFKPYFGKLFVGSVHSQI